jgi:NADPH:quinone reductase-like Zn-dependent oxidoreductase
MKALLIERHGPHADLQVHDVPAPPLRPGEVRVEVHALSVRPGGDRVSGHAAHVAGFGEAK